MFPPVPRSANAAPDGGRPWPGVLAYSATRWTVGGVFMRAHVLRQMHVVFSEWVRFAFFL